ncbi:MAG TPA: DUF1003 domain-containing protein [Ktedonobacteraceae bacterium]|nr:DUF1003 domain-containing protein [Ktedonobacteraceae bacterium]
MDITPTSQSIARANAQHQHNHKNLLEGIHFKFPTFKHDHPAVIDVNEVADDQLTVGQKIADKVAATIGSWRFIIIQGIILTLWITLNSLAFTFHWDNYPYVLCNLALSFEAAFSAPFIMMSQNRQAEKDRIMAESDYHTNVKDEEETRNIMEHLDHQDMVLLQLVKRIEEQHTEIKEHLVRLDPTLAQKLGMDIVELSKESSEGDGEITNNS